MKKSPSNSRWTKQEEKLLRTIVKAAKNPSAGFEQAAKQLGRTIGSVSFKYYTLDNPKKYDKRAKALNKPSSVSLNISFKIDDDWMPTKASAATNSPFLKAIEKTASSLRPGQSFPIPMTSLSSSCGWKELTAGTCLRNYLKKSMDSDFYNKIAIHEIKDMNNKVVSLRVRRHTEV